MRAALFDLDGTLLDCNSGYLYLRSEWRAGRISARDGAWAVWTLAQYGLGRSDLDASYDAAIAWLAGQREDVIAARTRDWFALEVRHRLRRGAREALDRHRSDGDRLVIATSSSIYAGTAAKEAYGLDEVVAGVFEVDAAGLFTGKITANTFGANKADRAREWAEQAGVELKDCVFYTDSVSDLKLLEAVGEPVCVNPDRRLARIAAERGWKIVDWGSPL